MSYDQKLKCQNYPKVRLLLTQETFIKALMLVNKYLELYKVQFPISNKSQIFVRLRLKYIRSHLFNFFSLKMVTSLVNKLTLSIQNQGNF